MHASATPIITAYPIYNNEPHPNIPITDALPINQPNDFLNKNNFIRKTFNVLMFQLSITFTGCATSIYYKADLTNYLHDNSDIIFVPIIVMPFSLIFLMCFTTNRIVKYTMFSIFTLSSTCMLSIVSIRYDTYIILQTLTTTCIISGSVSCYAYTCAKRGINFGDWEPYLFMFLIALLITGIFQMFVMSKLLNTIVGFLGTLIFSGYLLYDVNQLYIDEDKYNDDPIICAINIYLDIINIFLYILECLQCSNEH